MTPVSKSSGGGQGTAASGQPGDASSADRVTVRRAIAAIGPGVITGAADDDPSGIATYSIAGAQLGTTLLWTSLLTWPMMAAVQVMCARIGMVTGQGLAATLQKKLPRWVIVVVVVALFAANAINIGADLAGMSDAAEMLTGIGSRWLVVGFGLAIGWATIRFRYREIAACLKWLCLVLFAYVITAFIVVKDWRPLLHDLFVPRLPEGHEAWAILVAILGTTISPYLFFWQASQEVEEEKSEGKKSIAQRRGASRSELLLRSLDVGAGTFFSNVIMFFIIVTTAVTLHRNGTTSIETSRQAAEALRPLAGGFAYLLYTIGLVGVGLLAIPVLAGSSAYAFAEAFGWKQGLDESFARARYFYWIVILSAAVGVLLDYAHVSPIKALYWSAVINGLLAPVLLAGVVLVASDRTIMMQQPSSKLLRVAVGLTALLMGGAAVGMIVL